MENHKINVVRLRVRVTAKSRGKESESSSGSSNKPRERECVNSVTKLQRREIGGLQRIDRGTSSNAPEKFRNIQLQVRFTAISTLSLNFVTLLAAGTRVYCV